MRTSHESVAPGRRPGLLLLLAGALGGFLLVAVLLPKLSGPSFSPLPVGIRTLAANLHSASARLELAGFVAVDAGILLIGRQWGVLRLLGLPALVLVNLLVLQSVSNHPSSLLSTAQAVGRAAFYGFSPLSSTRAIEAMYVFSGTSAILLALIQRQRRLRRSSERAPKPDDASPSDVTPAGPTTRSTVRGAVVVVVVCAVVIVGAKLPLLPSHIAQARTGQFVSAWDANNILAWTSFAKQGLTPMKDFWYPYGNLVYLQTTLTLGPFLYFLYQALGLAGYAWVFWRLSGRSATATIGAEICLILLSPAIGEFPRYGFAFMISMLFCVARIVRRPENAWKSRLVVSMLVAVAAVLEADLLVYIAAGTAAGVGVELLQRVAGGKRHDWHAWFSGVGKDAFGPALAVILAVVLDGVRGQLGEVVYFYSHASILEAYSAEGAPLTSGVASLFSLSGLLVWFPPAVLSCAVLVAAWGRQRSWPVAVSLAAGGGAAAPLLVKDAIRPLTPDLLLVPVVVILVIGAHALGAALGEPSQAVSGTAVLRMILLGVSAGLVGAAAVGTGEGSTLLAGIRSAPIRAQRDARVLLPGNASVAAAAYERFGVGHFSHFPDAAAVTRDIAPLIVGKTHGLYVLGDDPIEYVLLHQLPPWQVNMYNSSPVRDQLRILRWLEVHRPKVVLLDRQDSQSFDGVPYDIRDPLIYQSIVAHYVPKKTVGRFDILVRRRTSQRVSTRFWVSRLGAVVDLGAIPDAEAPLPSAGTAGDRTQVLKVNASLDLRAPCILRVHVAFGGIPVTIAFRVVPARRAYAIPFDRLWPWGMSHTVRLTAPAPPGWSLAITQGFMPTHRLY